MKILFNAHIRTQNPFQPEAPAIAIEQKTAGQNPRSTVGTITDTVTHRTATGTHTDVITTQVEC